jgi:hypothetical protein
MEPKTKDLKPIEGHAVIAAGITAIVLPFAAALKHGADWATLGFIITAAALYLYQLYVFNLPDDWTDADEKAVAGGALAVCAIWLVSLVLLISGI